MQLEINDQVYEVNDDDPSRVLLWVLRDELGLIGTKFGCGAGICGACTIHVAGTATRTCLLPLKDVMGKKLRTLEGLASTLPDGTVKLHPVQQAFIDEQVPQCSWCMSGQMMTAAAFVENNPHSTPDEMWEAMNTTYCRCGCYVRIKRAVLKAAGLMAQAGAA